MPKKIIAFFLLLSLSAGMAFADTIKLKSGREIEGRIKEISDKDVVLDRTPLLGAPGGQPWGGYAGLSVRFAKGTKDARALTPDSQAVFADGRYRGRATAMDYTGLFEGREAGIAILDSPANINSPSPWYAINNSSMHYFSPAVIEQKPYLLKAGQTFTLRYRVVIHPGRWSADQLRDAAGAFASGA